MYTSYWELTDRPFDNTPNPKYFCKTVAFEEVLNRFLYTIQNNKGLCLLTGEIGCGKTTVSRYLVHSLPRSKVKIALIENPTLPPPDFIKEILYHFGVDHPEGSKHDLLRTLNKILYDELNDGRKCLIIIDEAQVIPKETFEEIRLLLNFQMADRYLLNLFLLGQPELGNIIRELPQLDQRIAMRFHLSPLNASTTKFYVRHRLKVSGAKRELFTEDALGLVYRYSGGIPRRINTISDLALLIGYGLKQDSIDPDTIRKAVQSNAGNTDG